VRLFFFSKQYGLSKQSRVEIRGGGVAGREEAARQRRKRYTRLALEAMDVENNPYKEKNHYGSYNCRLCLTVHVNQTSYAAHTQVRKHQLNPARRSALESKTSIVPPTTAPVIPNCIKKNSMKIGRPAYKVTKIQDSLSRELGLLFQLQYPHIARGVNPRYRFMSTWEQKAERVDKRFQYLIFAAEPYESVAFKLGKVGIEGKGKFLTYWDPDTKVYSLPVLFKTQQEGRYSNAPRVAIES